MAENQRRETEMQVKKLEAELRAEEAKLIILKKVMLSQKVSFKQVFFLFYLIFFSILLLEYLLILK